MFGFVTADSGQPSFSSARHDGNAEKREFEAAIDFITARLEEHPGASVYDYGSYE